MKTDLSFLPLINLFFFLLFLFLNFLLIPILICAATDGRPKITHCDSESDCLDSEACYRGVCQDPCEFANSCDKTAICHTKAHRPVCTCPKGYEGNPAVKCIRTQSCKALLSIYKYKYIIPLNVYKFAISDLSNICK